MTPDDFPTPRNDEAQRRGNAEGFHSQESKAMNSAIDSTATKARRQRSRKPIQSKPTGGLVPIRVPLRRILWNLRGLR